MAAPDGTAMQRRVADLARWKRLVAPAAAAAGQLEKAVALTAELDRERAAMKAELASLAKAKPTAA